MNAPITLSQTQLTDFLLNVAVVRPVFIWGPPGIGKSALVQRFAEEVGLPLNACSQEVQKAFYSLIHERRIGEYVLPEGSIVIGAGNRTQDSAIVKPMSSALINRMIHVHLKASHRDLA